MELQNFNLVETLDALATKRAEWAEVELAHKPLLDTISSLEESVKTYSKATGEVGKGALLEIMWVKGREAYDGKALYESCVSALKDLQMINTLDLPEQTANIIGSAREALQEATKYKTFGERTLRISKVKS